MTHRLNFNLEKNIYDWVNEVTGLTVLAENSKHKSPEVTGDFASYNITAPRRVGRDELVYKSGDTFTVKGIRIVSVEVRIYSDDAFDKGLQLQASLSRPSIQLDYFSKYGLLFDDTLTDITGFLETGFETRCLLTFSLTYPFSVDDNTGYIGEVDLTGEVNTLLGDVIINKQIKED